MQKSRLWKILWKSLAALLCWSLTISSMIWLGYVLLSPVLDSSTLTLALFAIGMLAGFLCSLPIQLVLDMD